MTLLFQSVPPRIRRTQSHTRRLLSLSTALSAALAVTLLTASPARAFDADEFWREPADLKFDEKVLEQGIDQGVRWQAMVYTSEIYRGEPMRIFAYYAQPAAPGKHPAVVDIHGGGGGADGERAVAFARAGYACLSFDWNTYGDRRANWKKGEAPPAKGYTIFGNLRYDTDENVKDWGKQFFALGADGKAPVLYRAVMAARRALTWLARRPEVDGNRLAVEGHSWGGFMAQLLAGIDRRVKAVVSSAASGAWAARYHGGQGMHLQELTPWQMFEWTRRYDPGAFAGRITAPILIRSGASDFFSSIDTLADYWPQIAAPKSLELLPGSPHTFGWDVETRVAWFNQWMKGPAVFPSVGPATLTPGNGDGWSVYAEATGPAAIQQAVVAWTTSPAPYDGRHWTQRVLARQGDGWGVTFTPVNAGGPLRVFVSVRDANGRIVSSLPITQDLPPPPTKTAVITAATVMIAPVGAPPSSAAAAKTDTKTKAVPEKAVPDDLDATPAEPGNRQSSIVNSPPLLSGPPRARWSRWLPGRR